MTMIEALAAKLKPYVLPDDSLQVILLENGLEESDEYSGGTDKESLKSCLIQALRQCKTLTEESDNGSKQKYDPDALDDLINELEDKSSRPIQIDMTAYW